MKKKKKKKTLKFASKCDFSPAVDLKLVKPCYIVELHCFIVFNIILGSNEHLFDKFWLKKVLFRGHKNLRKEHFCKCKCFAHLSRLAHKVSVKDGHDPASVRRRRPSSTIFKDFLF